MTKSRVLIYSYYRQYGTIHFFIIIHELQRVKEYLSICFF
jgi:hypothetical protein